MKEFDNSFTLHYLYVRQSAQMGTNMNISEIAMKASVSRATVSRVLNHYEGVKEETRKKVEEVILNENYIPNHFARSLSNKKSYVIGVLVYHIKQPFWAGIIHGIFDAVYHTEYSLFILNSKIEEDYDYVNNYKRNLHKLIQQKVDGIIVALANPLDEEDRRLLESSKTPYVVIQNESHQECDSVNVDNEKAAFDMTTYLIRLGHRNIVHFAGGAGNSIADERLKGYVRAMTEHKLPIGDNYILPTGSRFKDGYWSMKRLHELGIPVSAIVSYNDNVAFGAYAAAKEIKIRIPGEISIVGFDGIAKEIEYAALLPDLTTMQQPIKELGAESANTLLRLINENELHFQCKTLDFCFYEGSTCKKMQSPD